MRFSYEEAVERLKNAKVYSTGSKCLDSLLDNGLKQFLVYHIFGASGTGKTQLAIQASVITASKGETVAYIDTEGKFRPERALEIASTRGITDSFLQRIQYFRAETFLSQKDAVEKIAHEERFKDVRLVVIDTVTNNLTLEYPGSDNMFQRQSNLSTFLQLVCKDAYISGRAYLLTNRVAVAETEVHIGGKIMEYMVNRNIRLERRGTEILAKDVESGAVCTTSISKAGLI